MTFAAILLLGVALAVVVAFVLLVLPGRSDPRRLWTAARILALLVAAGAAVYVVAAALPLVTGAPTTVTVPLAPFTPHAADGIRLEPAPAAIVGGGVDHATLQVTGLSIPTRLLLLASTVIQGATIVLIAVIVVRLARGLIGGDPFRVGGRAILACALVVAIGGVAWSITGDLGSWAAGQEALAVPGWSTTVPELRDPSVTADPRTALAQYGWPAPAPFALTVPFWPLGAGLALALLAAAFRAGERLRRDTEGLV